MASFLRYSHQCTCNWFFFFSTTTMVVHFKIVKIFVMTIILPPPSLQFCFSGKKIFRDAEGGVGPRTIIPTIKLVSIQDKSIIFLRNDCVSDIVTSKHSSIL